MNTTDLESMLNQLNDTSSSRLSKEEKTKRVTDLGKAMFAQHHKATVRALAEETGEPSDAAYYMTNHFFPINERKAVPRDICETNFDCLSDRRSDVKPVHERENERKRQLEQAGHVFEEDLEDTGSGGVTMSAAFDCIGKMAELLGQGVPFPEHGAQYSEKQNATADAFYKLHFSQYFPVNTSIGTIYLAIRLRSRILRRMLAHRPVEYEIIRTNDWYLPGENPGSHLVLVE